jgi:hypothetical protein
VVKTDPVPVSGFYFVSVSMQFSVNANDILICRMITVNGVHGTADAFTGQFPNDTYQTLPITDAVKLAAGDAPAVSCTNNSSSGNTFFAFGTITATLISSPTPALSRVNNAQLKRPRTPEAATAVPVA